MVDFNRYLDGTPGAALMQLHKQCTDCRACPHGSTRRQAVFARGDERSTLAFVGEAPGEQEDIKGRPFVGNSGALFEKMQRKMWDYAVDNDIAFPNNPYICNVLKCRPDGNKLLKDGSDIDACRHWLWQQLKLLPNLRVIVALGRVAAQTLLQTGEPIGKLRGRVHALIGPEGWACGQPLATFVVPTWHPSYLLRQPNSTEPRQQSWEDLKRVVEALR